MKKRLRFIIGIVVVGGILVYFNTFYAYNESDELYGFPIPNNAELTSMKQDAYNYDWSKASEENGIPMGYKLMLKIKGWKEVNRIGTAVLYEKGNHQITLLSSTEYLGIIVEK